MCDMFKLWKFFFESTWAKISSTEEQQKYDLVKIMKKTWLKSGKSGKISRSPDFTWIENLCWTFHYISELFNHTNVHISSTEDVRLMPKKIRETFRKSTRPNRQMKKLNIHLISPIMNNCTEPSITWSMTTDVIGRVNF